MKHPPPNCDDPATELREHEMHRTILAGCPLSLWVVSGAGAQDLDSFPHRKQLVVRVYMRDGTAGSERVEQMATPSLPEQ
jgi:hypothetical protein